jgi:hypothetical protein
VVAALAAAEVALVAAALVDLVVEAAVVAVPVEVGNNSIQNNLINQSGYFLPQKTPTRPCF